MDKMEGIRHILGEAFKKICELTECPPSDEEEGPPQPPRTEVTSPMRRTFEENYRGKLTRGKNTFEPGDIVKLKTGGISMVIGDMSDDGQVASLVWMVEGSPLMFHDYAPLSVLTYAPIDEDR